MDPNLEHSAIKVWLDSDRAQTYDRQELISEELGVSHFAELSSII